MSGGLYGRGKAPERRCMPLAAWPTADRDRWAQALTVGDILDEDIGARARHSAKSNVKTEHGYGRWLTYCMLNEPGTLDLPPGDRIIAERVKRYVRHLQGLGNSTHTLMCRLQELEDAAKVIAPQGNYGFIKRFGAQVRARHVPARAKSRIVMSDELAQLGRDCMIRAREREGVEAATLFRDGLMIAFLAYVPIRRKNFAGLTLNQNFLRRDGRWVIELSPAETKTHAYFEALLPESAEPFLDEYLSIHRPLLAARTGRWNGPVADRLWVSRHGSAMTPMAVYDRIREHTGAKFGVGLGPHLFRDAAATTLATEAPEHVRVAAPVLGHRNFRTTEIYYRQAKVQRAHKRYVESLFGEEKEP